MHQCLVLLQTTVLQCDTAAARALFKAHGIENSTVLHKTTLPHPGRGSTPPARTGCSTVLHCSYAAVLTSWLSPAANISHCDAFSQLLFQSWQGAELLNKVHSFLQAVDFGRQITLRKSATGVTLSHCVTRWLAHKGQHVNEELASA
jgi:hypothetical protein